MSDVLVLRDEFLWWDPIGTCCTGYPNSAHGNGALLGGATAGGPAVSDATENKLLTLTEVPKLVVLALCCIINRSALATAPYGFCASGFSVPFEILGNPPKSLKSINLKTVRARTVKLERQPRSGSVHPCPPPEIDHLHTRRPSFDKLPIGLSSLPSLVAGPHRQRSVEGDGLHT